MQWRPFKLRGFRRNENFLSHPPLSYAEKREQSRQLSHRRKYINLIGHWSSENTELCGFDAIANEVGIFLKSCCDF